MSKIVKPLTVAMGAALLASVSLSASATSANPFAADEMQAGYMQLVMVQDEEGSCGEGDDEEGSCGEEEGEDSDEGEGSCGG